MFAGDETAGVRQGPVEVLIASDIDAALTLDRYTQGTAVRQARLIFDCKRQAHRRLLCSRLTSAVAKSEPTITQSLERTVVRKYGLGLVRLSFKPYRPSTIYPQSNHSPVSASFMPSTIQPCRRSDRWSLPAFAALNKTAMRAARAVMYVGTGTGRLGNATSNPPDHPAARASHVSGSLLSPWVPISSAAFLCSSSGS